MTIHVRAPATTANLGAGFDIAGAALELWNELEVGDADGEVDGTHLGVRAFARYASPAAYSFTFTDRIPRERGLGSSAAVVALGLVAGAIAAGAEPSADELLAEGIELEGHADNLAAALAGGVCLTWDGRIARIADDVPAAAIAVVPQTRVNTAEARAALPATVPHSAPAARRCSVPHSRAEMPASLRRAPTTACTSRTGRYTRRTSRRFAPTSRKARSARRSPARGRP